MIDNNSYGHRARQERFAHPEATRQTHQMAVVAKLMLLCRAAQDLQLKSSSVRVLAVIVDHMYGHLIESWPSQHTIGQRTGLARRTIQYAVQQLADREYITVARVQKLTNLYRLPMPLLTELGNARSGRNQVRPMRTQMHHGDAVECGGYAHTLAAEYKTTEPEQTESSRRDSHISRILEAKHG